MPVAVWHCLLLKLDKFTPMHLPDISINSASQTFGWQGGPSSNVRIPARLAAVMQLSNVQIMHTEADANQIGQYARDHKAGNDAAACRAM